MNPSVEIAQELAVRYHEGQVDKAGHPYHLHVLRVSAAGKTEDEQVVGALHDTLEDTKMTVSVLRRYFSDEVVQAIVALTHEPGEARSAYIGRVKRNPLAKAVKLNDLRDNLSRLDQLDEPDRSRLRIKYGRDFLLLEETC